MCKFKLEYENRRLERDVKVFTQRLKCINDASVEEKVRYFSYQNNATQDAMSLSIRSATEFY